MCQSYEIQLCTTDWSNIGGHFEIIIYGISRSNQLEHTTQHQQREGIQFVFRLTCSPHGVEINPKSKIPINVPWAASRNCGNFHIQCCMNEKHGENMQTNCAIRILHAQNSNQMVLFCFFSITSFVLCYVRIVCLLLGIVRNEKHTPHTRTLIHTGSQRMNIQDSVTCDRNLLKPEKY